MSLSSSESEARPVDGGGGGETARSLPRDGDDDVFVSDETSSPALAVSSCGKGAQETRFLEAVLPDAPFLPERRMPREVGPIPFGTPSQE